VARPGRTASGARLCLPDVSTPLPGVSAGTINAPCPRRNVAQNWWMSGARPAAG
jgi:hypothetical protein